MIAYLANNKYFRRWFGDFGVEELKKFIFLGCIFALVIGVYWTLRPLKDGIFTSMVHIPEDVLKDPKQGGRFIAWAKIVSLIVLFPLVVLYGKAVEKFSRNYLFYLLGTIYIVLTVGFGLYFLYSPNGLSNTVGSPWRLIGWLWYVFVESYGSLVVALFWAFASDTTLPESAKRGFGLTVMLGQLGAILGPWVLIPFGEKNLGGATGTIFICAVLIFLIMVLIWYFLKTTPKEQLASFHGKDEAKVEKEHEPGFAEGLRLMFSYRYLFGIFCIISIFEILSTIIDFNFKGAVYAAFPKPEHLSMRNAYLGDYAGWVNLVAFLCLFFGINNIQRFLGVKISLALMPFIIFGMIALFLVFGNVNVLFWIMVSVKAINYALNGPTMKQLYIPTTKDVRYKSQAWIETFGSRGAKATSSIFNIISSALGKYFVFFAAAIGLGLCSFWLVIALFLGTMYKRAIDEKRVVC